MRSPSRPRRHGAWDAPSRRASARKAAVEALEDRRLLSLLGQQLFPSDNPWNQQVTVAPVAANSDAVINNIISLSGGDGRLHPDFGQDTGGSGPLYGIPYNVVHGNTQPKVHVVIDAYAGESDIEDAPIPAGAVIEGDRQDGPTVGLDNRGDSHLIVYDVDNNIAYEFGRASRPGENADGQWHADQESVWDLKRDSFRPLDWTSADAAGLPILPGLVRPDEALPVSQGGQGAIDHAIRFTLKNNVILDQFLYPASHVADPGNANPAIQPPMGARFRLKAGVDISGLNPQSRVIAQAMKDYGLIVADNGSNFFFTGAGYAVDASNHETLTWSDADIQDQVHGLKSLTFSDFEVVDLTPRVTGLGASGGAAGSTLTVVGRGFSGAAGQLRVLFGTTPATNVQVLDDSHVTATVPAGTGTVDVRVQSGATTASDPENINDPVFGYGTSAATAVDRFTYANGTTTALASSADPSAHGQSVTFTATVSAGAGTPTGSVRFAIDGVAYGAPVPLKGGAASVVDAALSVGTHTVDATYSGAAGLAGSAGSLSQVVNPSGTATTLTSPLDPSTYGQPVTFTATVAAASPGRGTPGGTVTFYDGAVALGTVALAGGVARLARSLAVGTHSITAAYAGNANFAPSNAPALNQVVNPSGTATTLTSSLDPSTYGQRVTFTATVAAASPGRGTPGGTVTFYDGAVALGTVALAGGVARLARSLPAGSHSITAAYAGNANFAPSNAPALNQVVNPAAGSPTSVTAAHLGTPADPVGAPLLIPGDESSDGAPGHRWRPIRLA